MGTSEEKEQPRATKLADLRAKDSVSGRCKLTKTQQYLGKSNWIRSGFPDGSEVKNPPAMQDTRCRDAGSIPGSGRSPEDRNATQSSILAWEIPSTEEPGSL